MPNDDVKELDPLARDTIRCLWNERQLSPMANPPLDTPLQPSLARFFSQGVSSSIVVNVMLCGWSILLRQRQRVGNKMSLNVESLPGDRMGGPPLVSEEVSGQWTIPEGGALGFEQRSVAKVQSSTCEGM